MKKILFITPYPVNNLTAGQSYTMQLLEDLATHNQIDIVTFGYPNHDNKNFSSNNLSYVKTYTHGRILKLFSVLSMFFLFPVFSARFNLNLFFFLKKNRDFYDLIYLDFSQTFVYSLFFRDVKFVLMVHDVQYQKFSRKYKNYFLLKWIYFSEKIVFSNKKNVIFSFSKKDSDLIESAYGLSSKVVGFYLQKNVLNVSYNLSYFEEANYLCLFGVWSREENLESLLFFFEVIFPQINPGFNYKVKVIGGGLSELIKEKYASASVQFLGFVDDPYPIIANSRALIAPLFHGAGVKVKTIEALACGTPVIGSAVALEGIDFKCDWLFEASSLKEYLDSIQMCLTLTYENKLMIRSSFLDYYSGKKFVDYVNDI